MVLLEISLAVVLIWMLASCTLILGGCIGMCAHRNPKLVLWTPRHDRYAQKSDLYID
jgi:hypothetical protein